MDVQDLRIHTNLGVVETFTRLPSHSPQGRVQHLWLPTYESHLDLRVIVAFVYMLAMQSFRPTIQALPSTCNTATCSPTYLLCSCALTYLAYTYVESTTLPHLDVHTREGSHNGRMGRGQCGS